MEDLKSSEEEEKAVYGVALKHPVGMKGGYLSGIPSMCV